jgi:hypothetical protein
MQTIKTLVAISLVLTQSVLGSSFTEAPRLSGRYCGFAKLFGFSTVSMSLDFHASERTANFVMIIGEISYSFETGVGYEIDEDSQMTLETGNVAFNQFLTSFGMGLTPQNFNSIYLSSEDTLISTITVGAFFDITVESNKQMCKREPGSVTYISTMGQVQATVDSAANTIVIVADGQDASRISPLGVFAYTLAEDGSFTLTQEGSSESVSYTLTQIPGVDKLLLQYQGADKRVSLVLSNPNREDEILGVDDMVLL